MARYYITFGTAEYYPYSGGWVEVKAKTEKDAREKFNHRYGFTPNGCARFAGCYTEEMFRRTRMFQEGNNWGASCWESI